MNLARYLFRPIERLFLWSSGADLEVLDQVPTEKSKYYGIGGTIVFTALMASFAGGYAFFTAFKDAALSVFFGLFWGALIFNLDRYIVSSFGVGDGKRTISRQELLEAAPRLLMAALLGFVIATPLELKLFEGEIEAQIQQRIAVAQGVIDKRYESSNSPLIEGWRQELARIDSQRQRRNADIERKRSEFLHADSLQRAEWVEGGVSGLQGKGALWKELNDRSLVLHAEYDTLVARSDREEALIRPKEDELNNKIKAEEGKLLADRQKHIAEEDKSRGLMARLEALGDLTQRSAAIWWAKWLITLLFIFVEIAPVLFKMMTERGPYDDIVEQKKYEVLLNQQLRRSKLNEDANATLKANRNNQEEFLKAEMLKNREMLQLIVEAQKEIAAEAIKAWKEEQMEKMKDNVANYIRSNGAGPGNTRS
jgi:hypothetical protein